MFEPLESRQLLAVIPVTTTADGVAGSLRDAIDTANSNIGDDTILLPAGLYTLSSFGPAEDLNATGDLDVNDPTGITTIQGDGSGVTTIDGLNFDRVFHVLSGVPGTGLTLRDVTVQGGRAALDPGGVVTGAGGGIYNLGSQLTLEDSVVFNNVAHSGGGIYNQLGVVSLTDSTISTNQATFELLAGLGGRGGGIVDDGGLVTMTRTSVISNIATGNGIAFPGQGGGIYTATGNETIVDSVISSNQALGTDSGAGQGGGIYSDLGTTWIAITGTQITDNLAEGGKNTTGAGGGSADGGGIHSSLFGFSTWSNFTNNTIAGNIARGGSGDGIPVGTGGVARGGGIFSEFDSWSLISGSTISGNSAIGGAGASDPFSPGGNGGHAYGGGFYTMDGTWSLENSTVSGNSAIGGAGGTSGIGVGGNGGNARGGGFDTMAGSAMLLTHVTIAFNNAIGGLDQPGAILPPSTGTGGGFSTQLGDSIVPLNTIFSNNTASTADPDVSGFFSSAGYNLVNIVGSATGFALPDLIGANAMLDPTLQNNGGPTDTHALLSGSAAIDGSIISVLPVDQRGALRPTDGNGDFVPFPDIGAYEALSPDIAITKLVSVNGPGGPFLDANSSPGPSLVPTGPAPAYQFVVTTGVSDQPISGVSVTDPSVGPITGPSGDGGIIGVLELGETWIYTATGSWAAGQQMNTATVNGTFIDPNNSVPLPLPPKNDSANYFGADPQITIEKRTLDGTTTAATVVADFAVAGDGDSILVNEDVTWIYQVSLGTGPGNVPLSNIIVSDSEPGVTPTVLLKTGGDTDDVLETGETWYYSAADTADAGTYANTGSASGSFTDDGGNVGTDTENDTSSYFGADPQIATEKRTFDGTTTAATVAADFAVAGDGITISAGDPVTWIYQVTLDVAGNVPLSNIVVTDSEPGVTPTLLAGDDGDNILETGEMWYFTAVGTAIAGTYTNTGTASGDFTDTAGHTRTDTATDESSYIGEQQMGGEGCTPGFWKTHSIYGPAPLAGWPETDYHPDDFVNDIFGTTFPDNPTLLEALSTGGGGVDALMRHAVAALLNASNPNISYFYTEAQVIQMTLDALAPGGDVEGTKDLFEYQNEMGCDLSPGGGYPPPPTDISIQGMVWYDVNSNGQIDLREPAIEGVTISLVGTDANGNPVMRSQVTDGDGVYMFDDLPASDANGYVITEVQPAGYDNDREYAGEINGVPVADDADVFDDQFTIALALDDIAENFNFAERANDQNGGYVEAGLTATIGFWQNNNGQELIESVNGGPNDTQLGDWLAGTFPALYGTTEQDPVDGLAGKTNAEVADFFSSIFLLKKKGKSKTGSASVDPQAMAVVLAVYVTDRGLAGGSVAEAYGFSTFDPAAGEDPGLAGLGGELFDIDAAVGAGTAETLFGAGTPSTLTVMDILLKTDENSSDGVIFEDPDDGNSDIDLWEAALRSLANELFTAINEGGDI